MTDVLRASGSCPFTVALIREDGRPATRVDTGYQLDWSRNDLVLMVTVDELRALLDDLGAMAKREEAT